MTTTARSSALNIPSRSEAIQAHQQDGGRVAAVFPTRNPRALLRAHGFLPVEVWGPPKADPNLGGRHVQAYVCSIVRNAMSFTLSAASDDVDLFIVPHACDSLQGLGSTLLDLQQPKAPVLPFYLPRNPLQLGQDFFRAELQALNFKLNTISGQVVDAARLLEALQHEREADLLLTQLYANRAQLPLDDRDFYRLIRSRSYLRAEDFSPLAKQALNLPTLRQNRGLSLFISGLVIEPEDFFAALAQAGAWIADDDLACCGRRVVQRHAFSDDPWEGLIDSVLGEIPDPLLGSPIDQRVASLLEKIQNSGARGVIFATVKFCEPELFDQPLLRHALKEHGVASLQLEFDINDEVSGQTRTRLEAFCEMLS